MEICIYYTISWEKQEHILKNPCAGRDGCAVLTLCNTEVNEALLPKLNRDDPAQQGHQPAGQHTVKGKEKKIFLEQVVWTQSMVPEAGKGMLHARNVKT